MDAEPPVADGKGRRKRKPGPNFNSSSSSSSGRKKQKLLGAIQDRPSPSTPAKDAVVESSDDEALPRRSSRMRKAPVILDSSPVPSGRKRSNVGTSPPGVSPRGKKIVKDDERRRRKKGKKSVKKAINFVDQSGEVEDESGEWGSRLRARGRGKSIRRRGTANSSPVRRGKSTVDSDDTCLQEKQEAEVPSDSFVRDTAGNSVSEAPQTTSGVFPCSPVVKGESPVQHEDKNIQERREVEFHAKQLMEEAGVSATLKRRCLYSVIVYSS